MTNYNDYPVTEEEVEEMDRLCRLGAGVPFVKDSSVTVEGVTMEITQQPSAEILHNQSQLDPEKIIDEMMTQFSIKLKLLLTTLITQTKAQPNTTPPEGDQSLQACVDAVLIQSNWFAERVEKEVADFIGNEIDIADECNDKISDCVDNYFSYEFSLNDHCDIDDIVRDVLDDRLEGIVQERLSEMLSTATITFNN